MAKDASTLKDKIAQTRERMGDTVEALGHKADIGGRVGDTVRDRVESVKGTITDVVGNAKIAVNGTSETVSTTVASGLQTANAAAAGVAAGAAEQTQRAVGIARENPIGLTLVGLAVGYLIGALLPVSDVERERLGPIRKRVVDQAQATSHDLVEAGKAVVAETAQSAVSTALSSVKTHGQDVVDAAKARAEQM